MDPDQSPSQHIPSRRPSGIGGLLTPLMNSSDSAASISELHHIQQQLFLLLDTGDPKEHYKAVTKLIMQLNNGKKKAGQDCIRTNEAGEHVLHMAVMRGREDVVQALVNSSLGMAMLQSGNPRPLILAAERGSLDIVEIICKQLMVKGKLALLSEYDTHKNTALHKATQAKKYDVVRYLLRIGADITLKNAAQKTPLETTNDHKMLRIYQPAIETHYKKFNSKYGRQCSIAIVGVAERSRQIEASKSPPGQNALATSPQQKRISSDGMQKYLEALRLQRCVNHALGLEEDYSQYVPRPSFTATRRASLDDDTFLSAKDGYDSDLDTFPPADDDDEEFIFGMPDEHDDQDDGKGMGIYP